MSLTHLLMIPAADIPRATERTDINNSLAIHIQVLKKQQNYKMSELHTYEINAEKCLELFSNLAGGWVLLTDDYRRALHQFQRKTTLK